MTVIAITTLEQALMLPPGKLEFKSSVDKDFRPTKFKPEEVRSAAGVLLRYGPIFANTQAEIIVIFHTGMGEPLGRAHGVMFRAV